MDRDRNIAHLRGPPRTSRVVEFSSTSGRGRNGTDHDMRCCSALRVQEATVRDVVGYHGTATASTSSADTSNPADAGAVRNSTDAQSTS